MPKPAAAAAADGEPAVIYSADYILLPPYRPPPRRRHHICRRLTTAVVSIILIAAAVFLLWPSDPEIAVSRIRLDRLRLDPGGGGVDLDFDVDLAVRIRNRSFYSLHIRSLNVVIEYRGRPLGNVTSDGARVRARATSYVNATLRLDGVEVLHDVLYLIQDIARGIIPFDTVSVVEGELGFFGLQFPIEGKVSCEVDVSTRNETITHQNCYPE